ncbi:unnamed protein product [Urochloa humidicola]
MAGIRWSPEDTEIFPSSVVTGGHGDLPVSDGWRRRCLEVWRSVPAEVRDAAGKECDGHPRPMNPARLGAAPPRSRLRETQRGITPSTTVDPHVGIRVLRHPFPGVASEVTALAPLSSPPAMLTSE